jgi:hypothetical protein
LRDVQMRRARIRIRAEIAKSRMEREPRLMALAEWGLRELLYRAHELGATRAGVILVAIQPAQVAAPSKKTPQK